ncbi:hypothetical protein GOZ97_07565 [Agrobacterium vitis]|uniref:hypothetical protein n=1 Tax=Agrobacterium vitis TaxID=373 RepID=UPI0008FAF2E8|nr:hypothetical protein [Agrobacterium vitis]MUZ53057.1 hypothetical protein [Agrobacterium vitis]MUZ91276.1 hypothetical protein [Agrobacterium vitis]MVA40280.1 hypothetical protein [Agrobacterium vitis]NSX96126.1 hypothetical protein [Agrobacterium vitis]NSZ27265.1 hypothetical protein [Agrobacterium vitis]
MRAINKDQAAALKGATRRAVQMAGTAECFQHTTRVGKAPLSNYASTSEDNAEKFMPLDIVLEADLEAGSPVITEQLARLQGYRLVKDEPEAAPASLDLIDLLKMDSVVSALKQVVVEALDENGSGGRSITTGEGRDIGREGEKLIRNIREIMRKAGAGL